MSEWNLVIGKKSLREIQVHYQCEKVRSALLNQRFDENKVRETVVAHLEKNRGFKARRLGLICHSLDGDYRIVKNEGYQAFGSWNNFPIEFVRAPGWLGLEEVMAVGLSDRGYVHIFSEMYIVQAGIEPNTIEEKYFRNVYPSEVRKLFPKQHKLAAQMSR